MLKKDQIYHRNGTTYKVVDFRWRTENIVEIDFLVESTKQPLKIVTSASNFMSSYSLLPTQLELKQ